MSTERQDQAEELSAGGVVMRGEELLVIVPTRRAADGSRVLGLPKGHLDPGETPLQAALREVREETGVTARPRGEGGELGEIRYRYSRRGRAVRKAVVFFLLEYQSGDLRDHDHEVEEARWMPIDRAALALTYEQEREAVRLALETLER